MNRSRFDNLIPLSGRMKALAIIAAVGMYIINIVGFLDTQTGSALGCGTDWPLCNGQVLPELNNIHIVIEFTHRTLVAVFALVAVIFMVWVWMKYRQFVEIKALVAVGVGFIVIQSILGALAVLFVNPPTVLALHLGFGLLAMVAVWLLVVVIFQLDAYRRGKQSGIVLREQRVPLTQRWVLATWIFIYIAIYWGSYVAFRQAGTACATWPLCNGHLFPGFSGLVGLDFIHRLMAVGLAIMITALYLHLIRARHMRPDLFWGSVGLLVTIVTQILTGALVALSHVATGPYLLHVGNLMLLFADVSYLVLEVMPVPKDHDGRATD